MAVAGGSTGADQHKTVHAGVVRDQAARAGAAFPRVSLPAPCRRRQLASRVLEILGDERKETAAELLDRANTFFTSLGITVTAVMTDNGACYRSHAFAAALGQPSSTAEQAPIDRRPTARSNASTGPSPPNGPTPSPTPAKPSGRRIAPGSITTITTDPTPASAA